MTALPPALAAEIIRVRELQEHCKTLRALPNAIVEPQIAMMERLLIAGITALGSGEVIPIMQTYIALKDVRE